MNQIKTHIESIRKIMKEKYDVDARIIMEGFDIAEGTAKKVTHDAQSVFYGERNDDNNKGTNWSQQINSGDGVEVLMFWEGRK